MAGGLMDDEDEITGINVTPLVDVVLVLLIIFMVTANFIVSQSIPLKLPEATAAMPVSKESLTFAIDKASQIYFGGKAIKIEDVPAIIKSRQKPNTELQALIAADEAVTHGLVVKLIDVVRKSGVNDFAINVEQSQ